MEKGELMSTAFVLSGGASHGALQAGMLDALFEREITPDLIVGTSVGALNGAFIATRPPTRATARELAAVWRGLTRTKVFPLNPMTGALGFFGARSHLFPDSGLRRLAAQHVTAERLEETPIPLHVVATDVLRGQDVRLSEGPLLDALLASSAIPGVLPPVVWEGRELIDGGVTNNVPIGHAAALGATKIFVLAAGAACELDRPPRSAVAMLLYATGLLIGQRLNSDLASLGPDTEVHVLPPPCPMTVQPTDFGHADELIELGRDQARGYLDRQLPRRRAGGRRRPAGHSAAAAPRSRR
jgi:NTE family protein